MKWLPSFKNRSSQRELMDDPNVPEELLAEAMSDLRTVNRWLGGHSVTLQGLKPLLHSPANTPCHILDVGCGNGEFLRHLARYCHNNDIPVRLTGWDLNSKHIASAKVMSAGLDELRFEQRDILHPNALPEADTIMVCNLFLHHFSDDQIKGLLESWKHAGCKAIIINDLHRNPLAYYLFQLFGLIFMKSRIAKHDGRISIQRGFVKGDLEGLSKHMEGLDCQISWKWAFRYLCVLRSKNCL